MYGKNNYHQVIFYQFSFFYYADVQKYFDELTNFAMPCECRAYYAQNERECSRECQLVLKGRLIEFHST